MPAQTPSEAFEWLLFCQFTEESAPVPVEGSEVLVVAVMRCRAEAFSEKEARQLGRVLQERYSPLAGVGQVAMRVPPEFAARARELAAEIDRSKVVTCPKCSALLLDDERCPACGGVGFLFT